MLGRKLGCVGSCADDGGTVSDVGVVLGGALACGRQHFPTDRYLLLSLGVPESDISTSRH